MAKLESQESQLLYTKFNELLQKAINSKISDIQKLESIIEEISNLKIYIIKIKYNDQQYIIKYQISLNSKEQTISKGWIFPRNVKVTNIIYKLTYIFQENKRQTADEIQDNLQISKKNLSKIIENKILRPLSNTFADRIRAFIFDLK